MKTRKQPLFAIYDNSGRYMFAARLKISDMRRLVSDLEGAAFEVTDILLGGCSEILRRKATLAHTSIVVPDSVIDIAEALLPEEERKEGP